MRDRFHSARLAMRPHEAGDAATLHAGYGDAATMRWWSTPPHADVGETRTYLVGDDDGGDDDEGELEPGEDSWQGWTVTLGGEPIGTLSAGPRRMNVYEIGYLLLPGRQGAGYGREMVAALVAMLFADTPARRIYADVDPDNAGSVALLTRLGFRQEGRLRQAWESHIGVRDALIFGLLRDEWGAPAPGEAAAKGRALALLVQPIGLAGAVAAVFGLVLAAVPGVPRVAAIAVLGIAAAQIALAGLLRRRLSS